MKKGFIYAWGSGLCGKLGIEDNGTYNQMLPTRVGTFETKFRTRKF